MPLGKLTPVLSLLALSACAPASSGACAEATAHVQACGEGAAADALSASCDPQKADAIAAASCDEISAALGDGKGDGLFGWKAPGAACSQSWTCSGDLICFDGSCTSPSDPRTDPRYGKVELGGVCSSDGYCASGLLCTFATCGPPIAASSLRGRVVTPSLDPAAAGNAALVGVEVTAQRLDSNPMLGNSWRTGEVAHAVSDAAGAYSFVGLWAGYYTLKFHREAYADAHFDVTLGVNGVDAPVAVLKLAH